MCDQAQVKVEVTNLKEDITSLKSQIVESPEELKSQMEKMKENVKNIKNSIVSHKEDAPLQVDVGKGDAYLCVCRKRRMSAWSSCRT